MPKGGKREGAGRKPEAPTKRNLYLRPVRVTEEEYAAIQQAAQSANQTFSQWARSVLVEKAKEAEE